jgi:hypothetical protein
MEAVIFVLVSGILWAGRAVPAAAIVIDFENEPGLPRETDVYSAGPPIFQMETNIWLSAQ